MLGLFLWHYNIKSDSQEALAKKLGLSAGAGGYRLSDLASVLFGAREIHLMNFNI